MSEVQSAVLIAVIISGGVGFLIGGIVGIWMEVTNTKTWRTIADSRRDEAVHLQDQLSQLKKQLRRIAEDL